VDKRDEALAKLALGLKLVDPAGLNRAVKLAGSFPGRTLDKLLEDIGIIDTSTRRRLVVAFNDRLKTMKPAPFAPLPMPEEKRAPAPPRPQIQPPTKPKPPPGRAAGRGLAGSDLLPVVPLDEDDVAAAKLQVPDDDAPLRAGDDDDRFDPHGSDDTTDDVYAQPTMVLRDEPDPPIIMSESGEVDPPAKADEEDDAVFAEPTMILRDDAKEEEALLAEPTMIVREPSDEDEIYAEPTMVLAEPPDEEELLAQPTMIVKDEEDIYSEPTMIVRDEPVAKKSDSGPLDFDLRLGRDVAPDEQRGPSKRAPLQPGVKSKKGEGPLSRDEFQKRLKMRQGFEGFSIGDYKVLNEIARGAFGVVLEVEPSGTAKSLARERGYEGNLALKVMLENKTDPRETERFLAEVKVLIRFDHPHIVRMFDAGLEQGLTYYSMEFIKGVETRTHVLKHGPMPALLAVRVAKEIASALGYVHQQRTYHRDLKPQNIMLDQRVQPYKGLLIDFGLVTEHLSSADKGLILGTPSYMPPEQAQPRGGHGDVNVTSDIYSLGASLYFLLTGQPPFSGKDPKLIIKSLVSEKPRDPSELNPTVPKNVAAIVMKCLEKKQRDRFHSAAQLEADLQSVLASGQMMLKAKSVLGKFFGKPKK
jgi:hypothetical protein